MSSLNKVQNKIIIIGAFAIIACDLFPPWINTFKFKNTYSEKPAGYSLITDPPRIRSDVRYSVKLDTSRLLLQILVVAISAGVGVFAFRDKQP